MSTPDDLLGHLSVVLGEEAYVIHIYVYIKYVLYNNTYIQLKVLKYRTMAFLRIIFGHTQHALVCSGSECVPCPAGLG